jgi:hypothetical protein
MDIYVRDGETDMLRITVLGTVFLSIVLILSFYRPGIAPASAHWNCIPGDRGAVCKLVPDTPVVMIDGCPAGYDRVDKGCLNRERGAFVRDPPSIGLLVLSGILCGLFVLIMTVVKFAWRVTVRGANVAGEIWVAGKILEKTGLPLPNELKRKL